MSCKILNFVFPKKFGMKATWEVVELIIAGFEPE